MSFDAFDENCKKTHLLGIKSNICVIKGLRDMVSAEQVDGNKKKECFHNCNTQKTYMWN